ncbi:endonuclease/exonuclease/phosphatase family protein, partial [Arthrobacter agilis]|uniref:endonuclease/exonuclease/phosphatase family protein n=1 Tax=Arthrobacter agilis TaxID=37921 RepID=UPI001ABFFA46
RIWSRAFRKQQATAITAAIRSNNPQNLPVIAVGDFNSHKWTNPSNAPYDVMVGAGLIDPLGNTYKADLPSGQATVEKRIRTNFDSYNGFLSKANARNDFGNGTYIDYIFTSKMRVSEWETVANVDSNRNFIGVIPSDHNMIRATVGLP